MDRLRGSTSAVEMDAISASLVLVIGVAVETRRARVSCISSSSGSPISECGFDTTEGARCDKGLPASDGSPNGSMLSNTLGRRSSVAATRGSSSCSESRLETSGHWQLR